MTTFKQFLLESKGGNPMKRSDAMLLCSELCERMDLNLIEDVGPYTKGQLDYAYVGGSLRRGEEIVNDVDLLITKNFSLDELKTFAEIVIEKKGTKQVFLQYRNISFNLWMLTDMLQFGSFMMHITGPNGYSIGLRMVGAKNGYKINQYGVFKLYVNDDTDKTGKFTEVLVPGSGETEFDFYKAIKYPKYPHGKSWKSPEER